jgi:hypothetical protein
MRRISRRIACLIPEMVLALSVILILFSSSQVYIKDTLKSNSIALSIDLEAESSQTEKESQEDLSEFVMIEAQANVCFDKSLLPRSPEKTPSTPSVLTKVIIPPPEV